MPPYQIPYAPTSLYQPNSSIAEMIQRAGEQQAASQRQGGAIWSGAIRDIGGLAASAIQDYAKQKREAPALADAATLRGQTIQSNQNELDAAQQKRRLSDTMSNQQSMSDSGQSMTPESIAQNLQANGLGEYVPQVLKAHEETRASLMNQKKATAYALAQYADHASQFVGTPIWPAVIAQASSDLKDLVPGADQMIQQLQGMPPEQQKAFLQHLATSSEDYSAKKAEAGKANRIVKPQDSDIVEIGPDGKPNVIVAGTPKVPVGEEKYAAAAKALGLKSASDLSLEQRLEVDRKEAMAKRDPSALLDRQNARKDSETSKSYEVAQKKIEELAKPIESKLSSLSDVSDLLKSGDSASDSVLAPAFVKAMVGGAGSGVRITNAEIGAIKGARSVADDLVAFAQKFQSGQSFTPDQRAMMQKVVDLALKKTADKKAKIDAAAEALITAPNVESHRRIKTELEKVLNQSGASGFSVQLPDGSTAAFKSQAALDAFKKQAGLH